MVDASLMLLIAGAAVLPQTLFGRRDLSGQRTETWSPSVNYVIASPRAFLIRASIDGTVELAMIGTAKDFPYADGTLDIRVGTQAISFMGAARVPP